MKKLTVILVILFGIVLNLSLVLAQTITGYFQEDFEDGIEWEQFYESGTGDVENSSENGDDHTSPAGPGYFALFFGEAPTSTKNDHTLTIDPIDLIDAIFSTLTFWYLEFDLETDESFTLNFWNGSGWDEIAVFKGSNNPVGVGDQNQSDWELKTFSLASTYWISDFKIQFVGEIGSAKSYDAVGIDDIQIDKTIPVELTSFVANAGKNIIELSWSTATETENLGFHVYRSRSEPGTYMKISQQIIPGAGSTGESHRYSFTDEDIEQNETYYYKLADLDFNGNMNFHGPISVTVNAQPTEYSLDQNYPKPFNPETVIDFTLKESGKVSLKIYNLHGQLISTMVNEEKSAGSYSIIWNGTDEKGINVAAGIYLYALKVNGFEQVKKLVLTK